MTIEIVTGGTGLLVLAAIIWSHRQHQLAIERLDDRLAHMTAAVSLLTDTTEGGLRDVALEIGRLAGAGAVARPKARAATQRRITTAARRGRSLQDIAAAEQGSEGEVRLRLQLDAGKDAHASVR